MEEEEELVPISSGSQEGDTMVNMVQKQFLENRKVGIWTFVDCEQFTQTVNNKQLYSKG